MGKIVAQPPALTAAGSTLHQVGAGVDDVRGQFTAGAAAAAGCAPQAAGAFDAMQRAWQAELDRLRTVVDGVAAALQVAAQDYVTTDSSVMPTVTGGDPLTQLLGGTAGP